MRLRRKDRQPTHPGKLIREIILPELGITQTEFARRLGTPGPIVRDLVNERTSLTPDLAVRLSRLIGRSPNAWLKMQQAVAAWKVDHSNAKKYTNKKAAVA